MAMPNGPRPMKPKTVRRRVNPRLHQIPKGAFILNGLPARDDLSKMDKNK